jgi:hypothetical protein
MSCRNFAAASSAVEENGQERQGRFRRAALSREFKFPVEPNAFSLPTRDRAYVVGDHGMIYRCRIVPIEYTAAGTLDAPAMPSK